MLLDNKKEGGKPPSFSFDLLDYFVMRYRYLKCSD
nr:MAG TPA: hypothetical protein [Caudoviricetes sp.]